MSDETNTGEGPGARDPAAAAVALGAASRSAADAYLAQQTELARLQTEDLRREDALRHWNLRLVNLSQVMKVAFEIAVAFIVLAIAAVVGGALWAAAHADGLVIEAFQVPPSLAEQGLSGQVIASRIQDKLSTLQAQTDSIRAPSSYQNNWGNDIKVEIPNTGISIGEFNRYLRAWLGRETHITGEVWRTADGVSVVARAGAEPGTVFTGKESELDALLQKAAEAAYEKTQPYRYAVYLGERGETARSLAVLQKLAANAPPPEQAWAYIDWGLTVFFQTPDWRKGRALAETARLRDPGNADVYNTLSALDGNLDREEDQLGEARTAVRMFAEGRADFNPEQAKTSALVLAINAAELTGDFHAALALNAELAQRPDFEGTAVAGAVDPIYDEDALHDARAAAAVPARMGTNASFGVIQVLATKMQGAAAIGDWRSVVRDHETLVAAIAKAGPEDVAGLHLFAERPAAAAYALALARTGNVAGAEAAIAPTPSDCDACLRARGDIAAAQRQWDRAAWWFARAVRQAPSIPLGYVEWGRMLLDRGDPAGAVEKFARAHEKGPHFADPLELWGEALMAQSRSDLALAKFDEAARYAPHWTRLHRKWGEALTTLGRKDEAATQLALAEK
jgi:tetratricopeptide (TPR) repeat protein